MTTRGNKTRELLLDAAEQLFSERGLSAVSLREIRIAAGQRNTTAAQFHFGDREGLIAALSERHSPRLTAIQKHLYETMIREGRENDLRSLVEVGIRPAADYIVLGPSERAWIRILAELATAPQLTVDYMARHATDISVQVAVTLLTKLATRIPYDVAVERLIITGQAAVHITADRARIEQAGNAAARRTSHEVFASTLIDMACGALFAPVGFGGSEIATFTGAAL